jgi:mannosyltransferase
MMPVGRLPLQIGFVLVIALGVRLYRLDHENLWIDEVSQAQIAAQPAADIIRNYRLDADPYLRDQAPLSFLVTHAFLSPARPEWSVRLPAVIFGTLSVLALFLVAGQFFPHPIPLLAALLLALSPLHVWYSQDGRWYVQWVCLATFSYLALLQAWRNGRLGGWVSYAALTVLGVYTFIFAFLVVGCQAVSAWILQRIGPARPRFLRTFVAVQAGVVLATAPVLWLTLNEHARPKGTPRPTTLAALGYTVFAYAAGFSLGPTTAYLHALPSARQVLAENPITAIVLVGFVPLVGLGIRRAFRTPVAAAVLLPWLCGLPLLVFIVAQVSNVVYEVRYTLAALPAFVLLIAAGTAEISPRMRQVTLGGVLACFVWSLANHYWEPRYAKEDVRGALARVMATDYSAAPVLVIGQIDNAAVFYGRDLRVAPLRECRDTDGTREMGLLEDKPVLWVIVGRDWDREAAQCFTRLSRSHVVAEHQDFPGSVELWRFTKL